MVVSDFSKKVKFVPKLGLWVALASGLWLTLAPITVSHAATVIQEEVVCPIGGESFTATYARSGTMFGRQLDFRPVGPIIVPSPLAICPSNHLVLYQDFTEDELAQLADYINTPEYQHAAETETSYYLKYLLQQELGATREKSTVDLVDTAGTLIEATWEAQNFVSQAFIDGAAAEEQQQYQKRFARYAAASIDATEKALAEVSPPNEPLFQQQMSLLLIAADFERRLGRFADAQNSIEALLNISEDGWISESYVGIAKQQLDWIKQHNTEPQVIAPFE